MSELKDTQTAACAFRWLVSYRPLARDHVPLDFFWLLSSSKTRAALAAITLEPLASLSFAWQHRSMQTRAQALLALRLVSTGWLVCEASGL